MRSARLAAPSHVTFAVPAGTSVALSVLGAQGVQGALAQAGQLADLTEADAMVLELPRGPAPGGAGPRGRVVADYAPLPVISPAGATGLWQLRLRAGRTQPGEAGLVLWPLSVGPDEEGLDTAPLSFLDRQTLVSARKRSGGGAAAGAECAGRAAAAAKH